MTEILNMRMSEIWTGSNTGEVLQNSYWNIISFRNESGIISIIPNAVKDQCKNATVFITLLTTTTLCIVTMSL